MKKILNTLFALSTVLLLSPLSAKEVLESPRPIPVAADVDVVVVGGGAGAVAAAIEAAKKGAKVYLAAPRPYLGEDICASYRLWLEPGEQATSELAKEMFQAAAASARVAGGAKFSYSSDKKPFAKHADTNPPSLLSDGKFVDARTQSVQYDSDVNIVVDLLKPTSLKKVHVMAFQTGGDFEVSTIDVSTSDDNKTWKPAGTIKNDKLGTGSIPDPAIDLALPVTATARYVKFFIKLAEKADRLLIGELIIESDESAAPAPKEPVVATGPASAPATPMQVKRALDQALIKHGVTFLYGCYATDIMLDAAGKPAGIVMANKAGRQAVSAKVIIDATERGTVARMAGVDFSSFPNGPQTFQRNVVGGPVAKAENITTRERPKPVEVVDNKGVAHKINEYTLRIPMADASFGSFAAAEQLGRDLTWSNLQVDASETLFQVPPDSMQSKAAHTGAWTGADKVSLDAFQPAKVERLFVLGGTADMPRDAAAELLRPINTMAVGTRIGAAAAEVAAKTPKLEGTRLPAIKPTDANVVAGEVREVPLESNPRVSAKLTVPSEARALPVIGEYDVVVVGGGTGGAPAAISAGRQGAKTLMVEYLHMLGGVGTAGYISIYYHGNKVGFTSETDKAVLAFSPPETKVKGAEWIPDMKAEYYRQEMRKAGVDLWSGTLGAGAFVEGGRVRGVIIATPLGRGVVLAKIVVDSTGNADIACAAGAPCTQTSESEIAVQGTGLPPRNLNARYLNTDYTYVDETDSMDIWRAFVMGRQKYKSAYDLGQLIDTRERRRIIGDIELTPLDAIQSRTWPDTIVIAASNFDSHGYTVHPLFLMRPPDKASVRVPVPYRCLLPKGLDGILVTGLGVSAQRDTLPLIRMQADIQNQGYAAGAAASMLSKTGKTTRELDIKALQKHLVEKGNLPEKILTDVDSFPIPQERLVKAVTEVASDYKSLEIILTDPEAAKPLLRDALAKAADKKSKQIYAHILGMMGDKGGADVLIEEIKATEKWDKGWQFVAMGQFGASISPLDSLIIALGRSGDKRGIPPILEKMKLLDAKSEFSHFRAVSLALESFRDPVAAKPLADLLQTPGVGGYALTNINAALVEIPSSGTDTSTRRRELIEIDLARALYHCGDHEGIGKKILEQYAQDIRGHYARHAQAILAKK